MIRNLEVSDIEKLKEIHSKDNLFPFHDLSSPLYCIKKAIISDERLIGAALVRLTSETSLIIDKDVSKLTRAKELRNVFNFMHEFLAKFGLNDTHVFVSPENDEKYAEFLMKNFGFVKATGIPLYVQYKGDE